MSSYAGKWGQPGTVNIRGSCYRGYNGVGSKGIVNHNPPPDEYEVASADGLQFLLSMLGNVCCETT